MTMFFTYIKKQTSHDHISHIHKYCSLQETGHWRTESKIAGRFTTFAKKRFGRGKHTSINASNVALPIFQTINGPIILSFTIFHKRVAIKLDWPTSRQKKKNQFHC